MLRISRRAGAYVAVLIAFIAAVSAYGFPQTTSTLTVDAAGNPHPINPDIYGIANYGLDPGFAKEIQVPNIRWGGDGTTRYNWEVDSSNSGFDWYFMGGNGQTTPTPSASADLMINTYKAASNAHPLLTIPIIPYVNKASAWTCSFPVSIYGAQQSVNPYVHPNGDSCGNSISASGVQLADNNIYANHIDNTVALQQGWLEHLISTFGTAADGGVPYYQLDNEPGGWSNTHRDVEPTQPDYNTIIALGQQYALMIKQTDPSAKVFGPVDFTLGGWIGTPSQQNNLYAGQYYLQQMAAYDQANHQRILDYFDEHYYGGGSTDAAELASTRALWDSTFNSGSWVEQYYFDGPMMLIPRFQNWIQTYYPGTKLSISEYSFSSGTNPLVDALTEADVLGIYGRQSLDFANMWNAPASTAPVAFSFRLYRNFDGAGAQFGDTAVNSTSTNQGQLSVYGALRSTDGVLTVVAINKTTSAIQSTLTLANFTPAGSAAVYTYSNANLAQIVAGTPVAVVSNTVNYNFPAYSATVFAFVPASSSLTPTTTSISASSTTVTFGQSITFTASVATQSGTGTPTGSVTLYDGTTRIGSAAISSGSASFTIANLAVGTHLINAAYSGDSNYAASSSAVLSVSVASAPGADYSLSLSNSSLSVPAGGSGTLTINVTPKNGFKQALALACSGLPAGATCTFNPQGLNPAAGTVQATLTVQLPAAPSAQSGLNGPSSSPGSPPLALYVLAIALGGVIGMAGNRRLRIGTARVASALMVSALLALLSVAPGCGVGQTPSGSPATAYAVTVTSSGANAPTHTQQFMLSVTP